MNPDTKDNNCVGCGKIWKGKSLYCPTCQMHNAGWSGTGLAGFVTTFKPSTDEYKAVFDGTCKKCERENTITSKGYFCADCIHAMSWNSYLQKYTDP